MDLSPPKIKKKKKVSSRGARSLFGAGDGNSAVKEKHNVSSTT